MNQLHGRLAGGWGKLLSQVFVFGCVVAGANAGAATIDFSTLTLAPNSYWNGSNNAGGFTAGGAFFNNSYYYDSTYNYESWTGFAYSNITNTTTTDYTNQYSAITGGGVLGAGSNYALGFGSDLNDSYIDLPTANRPDALVLTNTTYTYYSMLNGDQFAKKFTASDWFLLTITGYTGTGATGSQTGTVNFYLAQNLNFVNSWANVSLSTLGGNTQSLGFELTSSDNGVYGMNTPAYFALGAVKVSAVPEPSSLACAAIAVTALFFLKRRSGRAG